MLLLLLNVAFWFLTKTKNSFVLICLVACMVFVSWCLKKTSSKLTAALFQQTNHVLFFCHHVKFNQQQWGQEFELKSLIPKLSSCIWGLKKVWSTTECDWAEMMSNWSGSEYEWVKSTSSWVKWSCDKHDLIVSQLKSFCSVKFACHSTGKHSFRFHLSVLKIPKECEWSKGLSVSNLKTGPSVQLAQPWSLFRVQCLVPWLFLILLHFPCWLCCLLVSPPCEKSVQAQQNIAFWKASSRRWETRPRQTKNVEAEKSVLGKIKSPCAFI